MAKGVSHARKIASAVCRVFGITLQQFINEPKSRQMNLARGVFCLACDKEDIHPLFSSSVIKRTRGNVINIARHYRGYYDMKDKEVVSCYDKVINYIEREEHEKKQVRSQ